MGEMGLTSPQRDEGNGQGKTGQTGGVDTCWLCVDTDETYGQAHGDRGQDRPGANTPLKQSYSLWVERLWFLDSCLPIALLPSRQTSL